MTDTQPRLTFGVYGAGGFAREVAWLLEQCHGEGVVAAFVDDNEANQGLQIHGIPVVALPAMQEMRLAEAIVIAIGSPTARERITHRITAAGFANPMIVHPRVERSRWVEIGAGAVICAGSTLTTDIRIGRGAHINLDCTIGHDVTVGEFATLAPGVHLSGWVTVGPRAYIGTGAAVINGRPGHPLVIGADSIVGAGACVTKNVPSGTTVVGVPARPRT